MPQLKVVLVESELHEVIADYDKLQNMFFLSKNVENGFFFLLVYAATLKLSKRFISIPEDMETTIFDHIDS